MIGVCIVIGVIVLLGVYEVVRPHGRSYYVPSAAMAPAIEPGDPIRVEETTEIERGDIVVFKVPVGMGSEVEEAVSRVIALPGEMITVTRVGTVLIGHHFLNEPYIAADVTTVSEGITPGCGQHELTSGCVVPRGHVFVMSDNREAAKDSRVYGPIPIKDIRGRV